MSARADAMRLRPILLALLVLPLAAAGEGRDPAACRGTLAGAVQGDFGCAVQIVEREDGRFVFVLRPTGAVDGVPAYQPGSFELPGPPAPGRFALDALGMGMASVAAEGGTLYAATKTSSRRGEVTLTFTAARRGRKGWTVHGTYRARLVPAGAGKAGEVTVEARF